MRAVAFLVLGYATAYASPDYVSVDAGEDIGVLSSSHTMLAGGVEHHAWRDRVFAEARVSVSRGDLTWIEERVGVGFVFHTGSRVTFALGWRAGDSYVTGSIGPAPYALHMLGVDLVTRISVDLGNGWRVRATPVAPTLYWHTTYGGALALELGVEHAL